MSQGCLGEFKAWGVGRGPHLWEVAGPSSRCGLPYLSLSSLGLVAKPLTSFCRRCCQLCQAQPLTCYTRRGTSVEVHLSTVGLVRSWAGGISWVSLPESYVAIRADSSKAEGQVLPPQ